MSDSSERFSPEEKGRILVERARKGLSFAGSSSGEGRNPRADFTGAMLSKAELNGAKLASVDIRGANLFRAQLEHADLSGSDCRDAEFWGAQLEGASFSNALLDGAVLAGTKLKNTNFSHASLTNANLASAHLVGTNLQWTDIEGVNLMEASLLGVKLLGARGAPGDRRGAVINAKTYERSEWTPAHLSEWLRAGAVITGFNEFPPEAQARVLDEKQGLVLRFMTPLSEIDRFAVEHVIVAYRQRNPDSTVRVVEYLERAGEASLRLCASDSADLVFVALALYQRIWEKQGTPAPSRARAAADAKTIDLTEPSTGDTQTGEAFRPALSPTTTASDVAEEGQMRAVGVRRELSRLTSAAMLRQLSWIVSRGDRFELWTLEDGELALTQEWVLTTTRERVLFDLLLSLYSSTHELLALLSALPGSTGLRASLPGLGASMVALVEEAVRALEARGLIDHPLFLQLLSERPRRAAEIACAARAWGLELPPSVITAS